MKPKNIISGILAVCALWLPGRAAAEGTWTALSNLAPGGVETMLLLPDGTVMAAATGGPNGSGTNWFRLTPDSTGHYVNGTWTTRAHMNYFRLYYSSQVLRDGRVFVAGAEYGSGGSTAEIYDPVADAWTILTIPPGIITGAGFTDSGSIMLNNGRVLVFPNNPYYYGDTAIYDPVANSWSTATLYTGDNEDESCPVKLPDDSILVVDSGSTTSERYIPSLNTWTNDSICPVSLYDPYGGEQGPAFLLPNGNAFFIGSAPNFALYTPSGNTSPGTWTSGSIPFGLGAPDAPGAMMFNGKVLCALSPTPYTSSNVFTAPSYFFEYDYTVGAVGAFTEIHAPGGGYNRNEVTFNDRMLDLPDGTVLFTDGGNQLYVYQPDGSPLASGKPIIYGVSWNIDGTLHIQGTLFNGISQGAVYGDNAQMDSNYPLVRFTDGSGNVYYGRTYNWSSTSVQTGGAIVTTECVVPSAVFSNPGVYSLQVVANGIASDPVTFYGPVWVDFNYGGLIQLGTFPFPYSTLPQGVAAVASGETIAINASSQPSTGHVTVPYTISTPMTIISVYGPSTIGQ